MKSSPNCSFRDMSDKILKEYCWTYPASSCSSSPARRLGCGCGLKPTAVSRSTLRCADDPFEEFAFEEEESSARRRGARNVRAEVAMIGPFELCEAQLGSAADSRS